QRRLLQAGLSGRMQVSDFVALRLLTSLVGVALGLASGFAVQRGPLGFLLFLALFGGLGYFLPEFWLRSRIDERKLLITNALPDVIDLLTVSVEAGLSFDQAAYYIATKSNTLLAQEFDRFLREKNIGVSNTQALRNLVERTGVEDLSAFVGALIQAEETGTRLGWVLRIQAAEMRVRRRQRAQALAQQAPVKMIFPLVLLIFPPILIVVLGPAIPRILHLLAPGLAL
ncbi:MAG TPA: type II secretion system F family protein, partial [Ktedonobacterales bacterium]|nr:type II secretion system F family protein [Ktedonobacterales bacterium]